jgi:hypothetical protein
MAKATKPKLVPALGSVSKGTNFVRFTMASVLARMAGEDLEQGYARFEAHLKAGNIVEDKTVGLFPGAKTYRIAKPQAPALI